MAPDTAPNGDQDRVTDSAAPPPLNGWTDTFDDGWRAALVALCDARESKSRRTRRWAYQAFVYLRQRHADQDYPPGRFLNAR